MSDLDEFCGGRVRCPTRSSTGGSALSAAAAAEELLRLARSFSVRWEIYLVNDGRRNLVAIRPDQLC